MRLYMKFVCVGCACLCACGGLFGARGCMRCCVACVHMFMFGGIDTWCSNIKQLHIIHIHSIYRDRTEIDLDADKNNEVVLG